MDVVIANAKKFEAEWDIRRHEALYNAFIEIMDRCDEGIERQTKNSFAVNVSSWHPNGYKSIRICFDGEAIPSRIFSYIEGKFVYESYEEYETRQNTKAYKPAVLHGFFGKFPAEQEQYVSVITASYENGIPKISISLTNLRKVSDMSSDKNLKQTLVGIEASEFYEKYLLVKEEEK